jgi:Na+/H+-dicarboxylate symporter
MYSLRSIDVMSCAKMMGTFYACAGLLAIPLILIATLAGVASHQELGALGAVGLVALSLFLPVFYGVFGFLFGALSAWLYNTIARRLGGLRIELADASNIGRPEKGIGLI